MVLAVSAQCSIIAVNPYALHAGHGLAYTAHSVPVAAVAGDGTYVSGPTVIGAYAAPAHYAIAPAPVAIAPHTVAVAPAHYAVAPAVVPVAAEGYK